MLTSLQNPLVKKLRKLHRTKERREQQRFLLEGTHLLAEACAADWPLDTVCCTPDWQARHEALWAQIGDQAQRVELISAEVLGAIATTIQPDGVVAAAIHQPRPVQLEQHVPQLGIAVETLQDPGNLGTVIRTAAAVGADALWLSADSVDLENPKVLRASAGQWFRMPMAISSDLLSEVDRCRQQGVQVIATMPTATSTYWQVDLTRPTLILMGNEGAGLSSALAAQADFHVRIPLTPVVESLNVGIATALMLYEALRQRQESDRSL